MEKEVRRGERREEEKKTEVKEKGRMGVGERWKRE